MLKFLALAALALAPLPAMAGTLPGDRVFTTEDGMWEVVKQVDGFTDELTCTAAYVEDNGIQATDDTFYVGISGGIRSVQARRDDNKPGKLYLPSTIEKRIGSVIFDGGWFDMILDSSRLRMQALTWANGVVNTDINTAQLAIAVDVVRADCQL